MHIIQHRIITVSDYRIGLSLEGVRIAHYPTAEVSCIIFKCRSIYHHFSALGIDTFHDFIDHQLDIDGEQQLARTLAIC